MTPIYDSTALAGDRELSRTYIGATAAPVLFMSDPPYKTPYEIWMEKTGRIVPEDISQKDVIEVGNAMEQTIADLWHKRHKDEGWSVPVRFEGLYRDEEYPFIACHIDFVTENSQTGERILIECKNSGMDIKKWVPEPPDQYYLQAQYEMLVTGTSRCIIAAWVGNRKFVECNVEASPELQKGLKDAVIKFWRDYVETDVHPPVSFKDYDMLKDNIPEEVSDIVEIRDDLMDKMQEYLTIDAKKSEMEKIMDEVEQKVILCKARLLKELENSNAKIIKIGETEIKRYWQANAPTWNVNVMQTKYPDAFNECRKQTRSARVSIKSKKIIIL